MRKFFALFLALVFTLTIPAVYGLPQAGAVPFTVLKNTVWSGTVIMPEGFYIAPDATLTLMPGTVVKLGGNVGVKGRIKAIGTQNEPIIFTSLKDDVKEDSNKDGDLSKPSPGDWGNIEFPDNCGICELYQAQFLYGGKGGFGTLKFSSGKGSDDRIRVSHCTISKSASMGAWFANSTSVLRECVITDCQDPKTGAGIWIQEDSNPSISGCTVERCAIGIQIDLSCSPKLLGNVIKNCGTNGIKVITGSLDKEVIWDASVPYIFDKFVIGNKGFLRIQPGVVVKSTGQLGVSGRLEIRGTPEEPVIFTSLTDDSVGGDTNNDQDKTAPQPGDWGGIEFTGEAGVCTITHTKFSWGGGQAEKGGGYAILKFGAAGGVDNRVKLYNCTIEHSETAGLYMQASSPSIYNCKITDNKNDKLGACVWLQSRSKPILYNCELTDSEWAIYCDGYSYPKSQKLTISGNKYNNIYFESPLLEEDAVWGADLVHYIPKTVGIKPGVALHLLPGVIIKYGEMIRVDGKLIAIGTKDKPIYFTSLNDDSVGGDSNGDSGAKDPLPGDNQGIQLTESFGRSVMKNCIVRYGGSGGNGNIYLGQATNTKNEQIIEDTVIEKSLGQAVKVRGGQVDLIRCSFLDCMNKQNGFAIMAETGARIRLVDSLIQRCRHLFSITPEVELKTQGNTAKNIGVELEESFAGIHIYKGRLREDKVWDSEFPYIIEDDFTIDKGANLTVAAGNVIKVVKGAFYVNGSMSCKGTQNNPVYITSFSDDSVGGDTNNNGQLTKPMPGDLDEIEFEGSVTACTFEHTIIRYSGGKTRRMGSVKFGAFTGVDGRVKLINCTIENSNSAGLYMINSSPYIKDCIIRNCKTTDRGHGIYLTGKCNPEIQGITFQDCDYAVYNNMQGTEVVLGNCYFGDASGPKDETGNPNGNGLKVFGPVNYNPFAQEPNPTGGAGGKGGELPPYKRPEISFPSPTGAAVLLSVDPTFVELNVGETFEITAMDGTAPYKFVSMDEKVCKMVSQNFNKATFTLTGPEATTIRVMDDGDQEVQVWVVSKNFQLPKLPLIVNPAALPIKVGTTGTILASTDGTVKATLAPGKSAIVKNIDDNEVLVYAFARGEELLTITSPSGETATCKLFCFADDGPESQSVYDFHAIPGTKSARLVWKLPNVQRDPFKGLSVTLDGKKLTELGPDAASLQVTGLATGVTYKFEIVPQGSQKVAASCTTGPLDVKLELWIGKTDAYINGKKTKLAVPPQILSNSTYVPFRFLGEAFGADVGWDNSKREASFWTPNAFLQMTVGSKTGYNFGAQVTINPPPQNISGRVVIPLRAASELLGAKVAYEAKTKKITINYKKPWHLWW